MKHFRSQELTLDLEKLLKILFPCKLRLSAAWRSTQPSKRGLGSQVTWPILKTLPMTIVHAPKR